MAACSGHVLLKLIDFASKSASILLSDGLHERPYGHDGQPGAVGVHTEPKASPALRRGAVASILRPQISLDKTKKK